MFPNSVTRGRWWAISSIAHNMYGLQFPALRKLQFCKMPSDMCTCLYTGQKRPFYWNLNFLQKYVKWSCSGKKRLFFFFSFKMKAILFSFDSEIKLIKHNYIWFKPVKVTFWVFFTGKFLNWLAVPQKIVLFICLFSLLSWLSWSWLMKLFPLSRQRASPALPKITASHLTVRHGYTVLFCSSASQQDSGWNLYLAGLIYLPAASLVLSV